MKNREIKFRAWDKENNQWVNQNAVLPNWSDTPYFNVACIVGDETLELRSDENFIWCEYTGLKDKNGKEIFEGDICKNERMEIGKIIFKKGSFMSEYLPPFNWDIMEQADGILGKNQEIIGNCYQNPELLVDKKNAS